MKKALSILLVLTMLLSLCACGGGSTMEPNESNDAIIGVPEETSPETAPPSTSPTEVPTKPTETETPTEAPKPTETQKPTTPPATEAPKPTETQKPATHTHSYGEWKTVTAATCTTSGVKQRSCSCGDIQKETIPVTGKHNYTSKVTTEATCTSNGVKTFTCSMCKDSYTETIAAGHKWVDATCTTPKTCSVCKLTEGNALGHSYADATSTKPKTCTRCGHTVGNPVTWYDANTYKVGTDIPAGEYYVKCTSSSCYFAISKDSSGNSVIDNEIFYSHYFVTLENGQYFELNRGKCTAVDNITIDVDLKNISVGLYRVGIDIPAGEYKLNATSDSGGYFAVYNNSTAKRDIRTNDNFKNSQYVTVYAGEYLKLSRCNAILVQETESSPGDDNKWSYSDATNLNSYAAKATDNASSALSYVNKALSANMNAYKALYFQRAISYVGHAQNYLKNAKDLADSRVDLNLTDANEKYATLQEKINYAYQLCDKIANLEITTDNYKDYQKQIIDVVVEIGNECLSIQKLSVSLLAAF